MTRRKNLLFILLILIALGCSIVWSAWLRDPFPAADEITKVVVTSYCPSPGHQVAFDLTLADWHNIRKTLTTPIWDSSPGQWTGLAHLQIYTRSGHEEDSWHNLWLFNTDQPRGAFSIAPSMTNPIPYRAGDSAAIKRALTAAYRAAAARGAVRTAQ